MKTLFARFIKDQSGATAIEYGMIVALISVVIIGTVGSIGNKLGNAFTNINTKLG
jgi:pilus assembly protein Flp/PilA